MASDYPIGEPPEPLREAPFSGPEVVSLAQMAQSMAWRLVQLALAGSNDALVRLVMAETGTPTCSRPQRRARQPRPGSQSDSRRSATAGLLKGMRYRVRIRSKSGGK